MNSLFIFVLLIVLMLTGMPISIALGLTVLTFLFTMTEVPVQAVALKLFTGIEKFEIMAIPFFILAGNFLDGGTLAWWSCAGRRTGLCTLCSGVGVFTGHGGRYRIHSAARHDETGLSEILRCWRGYDIRSLGHSDTAIHCDGDVLRIDQHLGR
jgi:hypothetical protein